MKRVDWTLPIKWDFEIYPEAPAAAPVEYLFTNSSLFDWATPEGYRHVLCIGGDVLAFSDDYGSLCWHGKTGTKPVNKVVN